MMPWTISTDGFPLKNEIWSGSCLEGESGVTLTSVWSLSSPFASSVDFRSSLPSSAPDRKTQSVNSSGVKRVSDQGESLHCCAADLRWAGRSRSPCRSWRGCPGAGGEWPIAPAPFYHPASFWRRPALSLSSRPLTSLKLWDTGDVSGDTRPQHKGLKEILEASSELKHTVCEWMLSAHGQHKTRWSWYFSIIMFLCFLCYISAQVHDSTATDTLNYSHYPVYDYTFFLNFFSSSCLF